MKRAPLTRSRPPRARAPCRRADRSNIGQLKDKTMMHVRSTKAEDVPALKLVLDGTQLFPSDMLPEMMSQFLSGSDCEDLWLTCEADGRAIGFCYAAPEQLTEGTWNMLAIAVLPSRQGTGAGGALVSTLEARLRESGHRVLIADTSGTAEFNRTREFYRKNGYVEEARIRDFWSAGADKVVFWKSL
jgi:GNAT superfamily N-acetyltransferase